MRATDPFLNPFLAETCYCFGGAKIPPAPKPVAPPPTPEVKIPEVPKAEPLAPAPTTSKLEVQQASDDVRAQSLKRKGVSQTLVAGDTGGYGASSTGKRTLLG